MAAEDYFEYFVDEPSIQDELDMQVAENDYAERISPYHKRNKHSAINDENKIIWSGNDWESAIKLAKKLAKKYGYADVVRGDQ